MGEENCNLDILTVKEKKMSMSIDFKASETLFKEKKKASGTLI